MTLAGHLALDTHVTGVLAAVPVAGTHPEVVTDVLGEARLLEQVVTLGVGEDRHVHLKWTFI